MSFILPLIIMKRISFTAFNTTFVVDEDYQFVKQLGQGAYGCVVSAINLRTGETRAIKKITNINSKVPFLFCYYRSKHIDKGYRVY